MFKVTGGFTGAVALRSDKDLLKDSLKSSVIFWNI
jgi:hypothetical protein